MTKRYMHGTVTDTIRKVSVAIYIKYHYNANKMTLYCTYTQWKKDPMMYT